MITRRLVRIGRRPPRRSRFTPQGARQGLPRPLVVHARRGRACTASSCWSLTGVYLTFFFHPAARTSCTTAATSRCAACTCRRRTNRRVAPELRRARRPRRCARSTTGRRCVFVGAIVVHLLPHLLHRRVPPAARDQLDRRRDAAAARDRQRLRRLLAARRPAVGHRAAHRVLDRCSSIPFVGTWLALLVVRRRVPGRRRSSAPVRHPRAARAGADRRAAQRPPRDPLAPEAHPVPRARPHRAQRRRLALWPTYAARSLGLFAVVFAVLRRRSAAWRRSTRLAVRPVRTGGGDHRGPTRLVHGLARGRAATVPAVARPPVRLHDLRRCSGPASCCPASRSCCCTRGRSSKPRRGHPRPWHEHHLLDRPRDRPVRTAIGTGVLTFYIVLFVAGGRRTSSPSRPTSMSARSARSCASACSWCRRSSP